MRACTASSTVSGSFTLRELVGVDAPALVLEVVGHLEDAAVVVDAHHLLEQRRVAAGERHGRVDQLLDLGRRRRTARAGRCITAAASASPSGESSIDDVPVAAAAPPAVAPREQLGPREADEEDRPAQALDEVREQLERVVVRPLQVVEDQDERLLAPCPRRSRGSS